MSGTMLPVLRFGPGRAMIFGGEASWRWKMLMPATDRTYEAFWRQSARWLASEAPDPVSVGVPAHATVGSAAPIEVSVRDASFEPVPDVQVHVSVRAPGGVDRVVASTEAGAAGRHAASFVPEEPGLYRVMVEAKRGDVVLASVEQPLLAGGTDPEFVDPRLNETVLRELAEESGGRYVRAGDAEGVAGALRARRAPARPGEVRDLWHNAWSFLLILALLTTEWTLRRRWGLR
jgi:hypothetical protein